MLKKALMIMGLMLIGSGAAQAGPFILDQTDADDHGFVSGGTNIDGWFYMQRVLENLAPGVTNGSKTVVQLGATGSAFAAAKSAFDQSSLASSGWNWVNIDGATSITDFFNGVGAVNINNAGIIQLDSGSNVSGGSGFAERSIFDSNGTAIDNFLGAGGALHSMSQSYGWLTSLVPGLLDDPSGGSGTLTLTAAGNASFPGLTNSDLNAGPFHGAFGGALGGLSVLFTDGAGGRAVGIGSSGGSVTNPDPSPVPAPAPLALLGLGLVAMGRSLRR